MRISTITMVVMAFGATACTGGAPEEVLVQRDGSAEQVYQLCTQCHGQNLEGNPAIAAPAVAGLPAWYVEAQLHKFKDGVRGTHFDDLAGMRMRPMAMSLTEGDISTIAEVVAGKHSHGTATHGQPTIGHSDELESHSGDAAKGKPLFAACAACHGPDAAGNEALKAPPLAGSDDWYLLTQLKNFKHGVRGANPMDTTGAQMRPMAQGLADEAAMRDVVAYIGTL